MQLPVSKAFGASLAYMATHALELLKALWLPTAILTAVSIWTLPGYLGPLLEFVAVAENPSPEAFAILMPAAKWIGIYLLASLVLYPMIYVGAMRHILRGERLRLPFYFQFGGDEVRMLATFVFLTIVLMLVDFAGNLGLETIAAALGAFAPQAVAGLTVAILSLAYFCFYLWIQLRLSLSLPAAVAEKRIGVPISWGVTKGNSLRLLAFYLLFGVIFLAIAAVIVAMNWAAIGAFAVDIQAAKDNPQKMLEIVTGALTGFVDKLKPEHPQFALNAAMFYLYSVIGFIVGTVPAAIAYRYIAGDR